MSMATTAPTDERSDALAPPTSPSGELAASPFAPTNLFETERPDAAGESTLLGELHTPFSEAVTSVSESDLEAEATQLLLAEFEDEAFGEALESLTHEAAALHSRASQAWGLEAESSAIAATEVEQWLEMVAGEADRRLAALAEQFGERDVTSLGEHELDQFDGPAPMTSLAAAQEDFLKSIVRKVSKVAKGVAKVVGKGVRALGRFLPFGKLLGAVRRLIRPLLKRVLGRAISRLPAAVQPAARQLAKRLGIASEAAEVEAFDNLADEFDTRLAEALATATDPELEQLAGEFEASAFEELADPVGTLDGARSELTQFFAEAEHQADPTAQMEQFIPAVLPLVKLGISIVGRQRVVGLVAKLVAELIRPMVGAQLAPVLSRHIASSGLSLIGLEAEAADPRLGAEALTAIVEETVHEVFEMPPASLEDELVTAAAVHEAFVAAAARHLPAEVLRSDVVAEHGEAERGIWVMMPRRGRRRYLRYSRRIPIVVTRPVARGVVFADGETLEDRLQEAGVTSFPAEAELELFETLPGTEVGHIAAAELREDEAIAPAIAEFEELDEATRLPVNVPRSRSAATPASRASSARPGRRTYYRIHTRGRRLRRRSPIALRLDLSSQQPLLTVRVRLGEHRAHALAAQVARGQGVAVVAAFRRWADGPIRAVVARRLVRMLGRRQIVIGAEPAERVAAAISAAMVLALADEVKAGQGRLAAAAKDPAVGVTLTFAFRFADRAALTAGTVNGRQLDIAAGWQRG